MKKRAEAYTLTKSEFQLLTELAKGSSTVSKLAKKIGKSQPLVTLLWRKLQEKGLATATRKGMTKTIQLSDIKHSILLRDLLVRRPDVPWEKLLADSNLPILIASLEEVSLQEIREKTQVSEITLWRRLRNLMAHGLVTEADGIYRVSPRWQTLSDFLLEYSAYALSQIAKEASAQAVILWHSGFEFLMRTPAGTEIEETHFHPTATSKLHEYGIPLLSDYEYYFYSRGKSRLSVEDVSLHTLLAERGSLRYIMYSLLLMKKCRKELDIQYLLGESEKLALRNQVEGMLRFLDKGEIMPGVTLPSNEEFSERAKEYGVV